MGRKNFSEEITAEQKHDWGYEIRKLMVILGGENLVSAKILEWERREPRMFGGESKGRPKSDGWPS